MMKSRIRVTLLVCLLSVLMPLKAQTVMAASKAGIFRQGYFWLLDVDGNQQFNSPPDAGFPFGGIAGFASTS